MMAERPEAYFRVRKLLADTIPPKKFENSISPTTICLGFSDLSGPVATKYIRKSSPSYIFLDLKTIAFRQGDGKGYEGKTQATWQHALRVTTGNITYQDLQPISAKDETLAGTQDYQLTT